MLIASLRQAFPKAEFNEEDLTTMLQPTWDEQWRNGNSAKTVAATTCSCDGRTIQPSPAVYVNLPRGAARGPANLPRGVIPNPAALRESIPIEKLKRAALYRGQSSDQVSEQMSKLALRSPARDQEGLSRATSKMAELREKYEAEMRELRQLHEAIANTRSQSEMEFVRALPPLPTAPEALDFVLGIKPRKEKPAKAEKPGKRETC
ncbi:MAG: hypothetical protein IPN05_09470 [Sulfuritalea sp.]|nr:hypothetical protein [Sulfuritalea sp.]